MKIKLILKIAITEEYKQQPTANKMSSTCATDNCSSTVSMENWREGDAPREYCEDCYQKDQEDEEEQTFVKWTEEDFCDRDTCYFCKTKNNGDWDKSCEDAVCCDCSDKWEYIDVAYCGEGYYRKCYDCGACDKCKEWNTDEEEEEEEKKCTDCENSVVDIDDRLCHSCYHKSCGVGECYCGEE